MYMYLPVVQGCSLVPRLYCPAFFRWAVEPGNEATRMHISNAALSTYNSFFSRQDHPRSRGSHRPLHVLGVCLGRSDADNHLRPGADLQARRDVQCQRDCQRGAGLSGGHHRLLPLHRSSVGSSDWRYTYYMYTTWSQTPFPGCSSYM